MSTGGELSGGPAGPRKYKKGDADWFVEPAWCTEAPLEHEQFPGPVWDPAAGMGTIPEAVTRMTSARCWGSDLNPRGFPGIIEHDFFSKTPPWTVASIICNPPFGLALEFCERAINVAQRKVAMLVQAKFPYSQGRHRFFTRNHPPTKLYFLSRRPSMPPGEGLVDGTVERGGGKMDFLWVVWERGRAPEAPGWLL